MPWHSWEKAKDMANDEDLEIPPKLWLVQDGYLYSIDIRRGQMRLEDFYGHRSEIVRRFHQSSTKLYCSALGSK